MPLSKESVEKLFAEQVGRPVAPDDAEAIAALVNPLIEALNAVDPQPIFLLEPSTVFQPAYPPERSARDVDQ